MPPSNEMTEVFFPVAFLKDNSLQGVQGQILTHNPLMIAAYLRAGMLRKILQIVLILLVLFKLQLTDALSG